MWKNVVYLVVSEEGEGSEVEVRDGLDEKGVGEVDTASVSRARRKARLLLALGLVTLAGCSLNLQYETADQARQRQVDEIAVTNEAVTTANAQVTRDMQEYQEQQAVREQQGAAIAVTNEAIAVTNEAVTTANAHVAGQLTRASEDATREVPSTTPRPSSTPDTTPLPSETPRGLELREGDQVPSGFTAEELNEIWKKRTEDGYLIVIPVDRISFPTQPGFDDNMGSFSVGRLEFPPPGTDYHDIPPVLDGFVDGYDEKPYVTSAGIIYFPSKSGDDVRIPMDAHLICQGVVSRVGDYVAGFQFDGYQLWMVGVEPEDLELGEILEGTVIGTARDDKVSVFILSGSEYEFRVNGGLFVDGIPTPDLPDYQR